MHGCLYKLKTTNYPVCLYQPLHIVNSMSGRCDGCYRLKAAILCAYISYCTVIKFNVLHHSVL